MKDRVLAVAVMAGALVYLYADMQLPRLEIGDALGPKVFPALIGVGLFMSGLMLFFAKPRAVRMPLQPTSEPEPSRAERRHHRLVLLGMALWTAAYYVAFEPVGYVVSTLVYTLALLVYFNRRRLVANLLIAAGFTAAAWLVFGKFLAVSLPPGLLGA